MITVIKNVDCESDLLKKYFVHGLTQICKTFVK